MEYSSHHFRIHGSSSKVLRGSQQLSRIFGSEPCHLLGLGAGMTQSCRKHLDAARWLLALTAGVDMVAEHPAIVLGEKYRNDLENIPSTYSPLSLLKQVLASFYGNRLRKKNMLRSLDLFSLCGVGENDNYNISSVFFVMETICYILGFWWTLYVFFTLEIKLPFLLIQQNVESITKSFLEVCCLLTKCET